MTARTYTTLAIALACATAAQAERIATKADFKPDTNFAAHMASPEVKAKLLEMAKQWDTELGTPCKETYKLDMAKADMRVTSAIDTPDRGKPPVAGVWQYHFTVERCGKPKVYNVLVGVDDQKALQYAPLVPGDTAAEPRMVRDGIRGVGMVTMNEVKAKQNKECKDFAVLDTKVTQPGKTGADGQPGRSEELWTVRYCAEERKVPMCFLPRPKGGLSFAPISCEEADKRLKAKAEAAAAAASQAAARRAAQPASQAGSAAAAPAASQAPAATAKP